MHDLIEAGTKILTTSGEMISVTEELARQMVEGDRLVVAPAAGSPAAGAPAHTLLRIPAADYAIARDAVSACVDAFEQMDAVSDAQIIDFFERFAEKLASDTLWSQIEVANQSDVENARARGRSTTRLTVSDAMRQNMIDGLRGWATTASRRDAILEQIDHDGFRIELVGAALGIVAFVFEGRPNVLADACGVLRGGNTAIFRIGSDALGTAREIMLLAVRPALKEAGLPENAISLVDSPSHAAGWSLFLDDRLSLAVARGSGPAVDLLGSLAQSVGTPVSLHGTGGAWLIATASADETEFAAAVRRSLDRKVCNTLNVCCIEQSSADRLVPHFLHSLKQAAENRGANFKLHVVAGSESHVPAELFETRCMISRAEGEVDEAQAQLLQEDQLCEEWEWEGSPEVTLVVVKSMDEAIDLFNRHSPRLVASLVSRDGAQQQRFWDRVRSPFVGDGHTRWVDGQFALAKPELGLSNWENGRLFGRSGILTGDSVYTVRTRYVTTGE